MSSYPASVMLLVCLVIFASDATAAKPDQVEEGEVIYRAKCDYCHGAGIQRGGMMRLEARYKGSKPALLEARTDLTPEMIRVFVRRPTLGMAPIRPTEITDEELESLIAFLTRNNTE